MIKLIDYLLLTIYFGKISSNLLEMIVAKLVYLIEILNFWLLNRAILRYQNGYIEIFKIKKLIYIIKVIIFWYYVT